VTNKKPAWNLNNLIDAHNSSMNSTVEPVSVEKVAAMMCNHIEKLG